MRKLSIKTLKKKTDKIFSEYIRKRDKGVCFTSGVKKHWKEQQAGHCVSRSFLGTRYDERNVHCQTMRDNIFLHGNMIAYCQKMEEAYGKGILEELQKQSKWTIIEFVTSLIGNLSGPDTTLGAYQWLINYYTEKLKGL